MNIDNIEILDLKSKINQIFEKKIIAIEKGCQKEVLIEINNQIEGKSIKLVLVCDYNKNSTDFLLRNLEVLPYLYNIKALSILVNSSKELEQIDNVQNISDLIEFKLSGYYSKNINIEVIEKFKNLKSLELEGLSDNKKYKLLQIFDLEKLAIEKLDLSKIQINTNLKSLKITKELISQDLLAEKFPYLNYIELVNCKKIEDFSFLSHLSHLENIIINNTNIEVFPKVSKSVTKIQLLTNKKLKNIDSLFELTNLTKIALTDSAVNFEDVVKISDLQLITFYFRSKSKSENEAFERIASKRGFTNNLFNW